MKTVFSVTAQPCPIADSSMQAEYEHLSDECQQMGHSLNLLHFMRNRLRIQPASFQLSEEFQIPTINVMISAKTVPYLNGSLRFFFTLFEPSTPHILSTYFDKVLFDVGKNHFEWLRNPTNTETDGIEYVIRSPECPLKVSCVLYPDFPVRYFVVPDHLRQVTRTSIDHFAHILKSVVRYALNKGLFAGNVIICDDVLHTGLDAATVALDQLPIALNSLLLPLAPTALSFVLLPDSPIHNVRIALPDFSAIRPAAAVATSDLNSVLAKFAREKEAVDFLAAIARNPYEAIEAEITGHTNTSELTDETSPEGPTVVTDPMNPARRSTPFYWQPWVADYIPRFLEENKIVHGRYVPKK
jgi:hypothetical protein